MAEKQLENVNFELIRYANCWEDADVLLKGLSPDSGSRIMSIASAGDNSFSLLTCNPTEVIAVDISLPQLFLVQLKKVAIQQLDRTNYMGFIGFSPIENRKEMYSEIRLYLPKDCRGYWDQNEAAISEGVINTGKFERYFQLFKKEYLHPIHSQETVNELFRTKSEEEQRNFHDTIWHNEAWKKMYRFFFGEQMMGSQGRDPEFLKHVEGSVPDLILAQEAAHLRKVLVQKNYFLYYILNNRFDQNYLPHYVRPENYDRVKANIHRLNIHHGLLDSALNVYSNCTHFNLSDIFEYMDLELFKKVSGEILRQSARHAKIAYWNLMIPREISSVHADKVENLTALSESLTATDMGYFYRAFKIDQKK